MSDSEERAPSPIDEDGLHIMQSSGGASNASGSENGGVKHPSFDRLFKQEALPTSELSVTSPEPPRQSHGTKRKASNPTKLVTTEGSTPMALPSLSTAITRTITTSPRSSSHAIQQVLLSSPNPGVRSVLASRTHAIQGANAAQALLDLRSASSRGSRQVLSEPILLDTVDGAKRARVVIGDKEVEVVDARTLMGRTSRDRVHARTAMPTLASTLMVSEPMRMAERAASPGDTSSEKAFTTPRYIDKQQKAGEISSFIYKINNMITQASSDERFFTTDKKYPLIHWSDDGRHFIIHEPDIFTRVMIPQHFRHQKLPSFIRQLNQYGFKKLNRMEHDNFIKYKTEYFEYYHEHFHRDHKEHWFKVKRRRAEEGEGSRGGGGSSQVIIQQAPQAPPTIIKQISIQESEEFQELQLEVKRLANEQQFLSSQLTISRKQNQDLMKANHELKSSNKGMQLQFNNLWREVAEMKEVMQKHGISMNGPPSNTTTRQGSPRSVVSPTLQTVGNRPVVSNGVLVVSQRPSSTGSATMQKHALVNGELHIVED